MTKKDSIKKHSSNLRKQAEEKLQNQSTDQSNISPEQARHLLHELQVHQIELEMQNEELHRAQAELETSRTKYFDLYDLAPVGYLTIDKKGLIKEANLTATQLLGVERSFVVKKPLTHFIYRDDQDIHYLHLKKLFDTGIPQEYELRFVKKDGSQFWAFLKSTTVQEEDSGSIVCQTALIDISERKQIDDELEGHREHLEELVIERTLTLDIRNTNLSEEITKRKRVDKALVKSALEIEDLYNNAPCGYHSLDKETIFVRINDTELKWLGYTREEIIGKMKFTDVLNDASKKISKETFPRFIKQGWISHLEFDMIRKDGTIMPVLLNATAIKDASGKFVMSRSTLFDITERKQAEEEKMKFQAQLVQLQKMEALGRFAGGIAHDLNNILYPVIIDTEYLLEESLPGTSLHETLKQLLSAAYRQRDMVKQILSFSRRSEQKFQPIMVAPLIKEMLYFIRSSLPSTIEIQQHIDAPSDTILGDSTQIHQVIMNLFKNAVDALESQKGKIEIKLVNTYIEEPLVHPEIKPGQYLQLSVRDTGCGILPEIMDHIFEPFFTTKGVGKGSGMGLSIIHGIIKSHGGAITVDSEQGKGSQFHVYLPVRNGAPQTKVQHKEKDLLIKEKGKILLVDDEKIVLSSLKNALKRSGYEVIAMRDSLEAFVLFREAPHEFDLVITDLTMPKITGIELAKKLMEIRSDIPIILCTGYSDVIEEQEIKTLGIRELLLKPSSTSDLNAVVRRVLDK